MLNKISLVRGQLINIHENETLLANSPTVQCSESFHPRFEFKNQVTATAEPLDNVLAREQLQILLKRILFEPELEGTDCENDL